MGPPALEALAALEARTVAVDGGRLKLEWSTLRERPGTEVRDLLWWEGDELVGFVGLYAFGPPDVELAGMVDPAWRRRGIATQLLAAARALAREQGFARALLVTPRDAVGGRALALAHSAVHDHAEHALELDGPPLGTSDELATLRAARAGDAPEIARLLEAGFGHVPGDVAEQLASDPARTVVVELDGRVVGTVRLSLDGDVGGVYGFVIDPDFQGRGIGRDVLRRVCEQLRSDGAARVRLEVAVENDRALGLYTSVGFEQVTTEDYFALALS